MSNIMAIVTTDEKKVHGGGAPTFYAGEAEEMQKTAFTLEKILDATAHDLKNGVIILVNHKMNSEKH
jgi:hypothetical protein